MKYYLITFSAEITLSGNRVYWSKVVNSDPVDYFIGAKKEEEAKQALNHYKNFALNFFTEITEQQYSKLNN